MRIFTRNPQPETRNSYWLLLGVLILIIGLYLGKSFNGPAFTPATFAHKYYFYGFPVDSLAACAARYPEKQEMIASAAGLFAQKNFADLSPILETLSKEFPEERTFRFYAGLTAHYLKNKDIAIATLLLLAKEQGELQQAAQWYTALTYVLFNESENAIQLLKTIEDGPYLDKAKGLIADLE